MLMKRYQYDKYGNAKLAIVISVSAIEYDIIKMAALRNCFLFILAQSFFSNASSQQLLWWPVFPSKLFQDNFEHYSTFLTQEFSFSEQ